MKKHMHYDAAEAAAIVAYAASMQVQFNQDQGIIAARQLDYIKTQTYDRKLPPMTGLTLLPQESDTPIWAETITYRSYDLVGSAKIIANYADDLPRADVSGTETTVPVRTIGDSYGYNVNELNASAALGVQLPARKGTAARRAIEVKMNQIAMTGDANYGLYGLTNHPNIGATTGLTGNWGTTATAAQIIADFDILYDAVRVQSKGVHTPNTFAAPQSAISGARRKYVTDSGGKNALQVIRENYPDVTIISVPEFESVSGSSYAIMGEFAAENAALETVMPFNQLPAQARGLEFVVPCMARTGGVSVHYPLAFTKAAGL
jgi:hypothetical protein